MDKDKTIDLSRNIVVAASNLIPGIGGVLTVFLDKYLPSTMEQRREEFLRTLSSDIDNLPSSVIERIMNDQEYHSLMLKVFISVVQEDKEIKKKAFRNILLNAATTINNTINENEFYIKLLSDMTTDQIRILHLFYLRDIKKSISFKNVYSFITKHWKNIDESYRFALITEIMRYGLITSSQKSNKAKGEGHQLSSFGERFILYIFQPNETQDDYTETYNH